MHPELSLFDYLTPEQKVLVKPFAQKIDFDKGQVVHRHGGSCVGIIQVITGSIRFSVLSEEGREITLYRADAGQNCILSAGCVLHGSDLESQVTAEGPTQVRILPTQILSQLMNENQDVERIVYKQAVSQYFFALRTIQRIVFFSLEKRLAFFLREESMRQGGLNFKLTHEQIARCIGSSREVVTRMLNQLADRGIVTLGRGSVTVTSRKALESLLN